MPVKTGALLKIISLQRILFSPIVQCCNRCATVIVTRPAAEITFVYLSVNVRFSVRDSIGHLRDRNEFVEKEEDQMKDIRTISAGELVSYL